MQGSTPTYEVTVRGPEHTRDPRTTCATATYTHGSGLFRLLRLAQQLDSIQEGMLASIAAGEKVDLTQEELQLLQQNPLQGQAILDRVHEAESQKMMRDTVTKTADDLNISYSDLAQYYDNVNDGMTPEKAWGVQAHMQGFVSPADYDAFRTQDPELHLDDIMNGQRDFATKMLDLHAKATDAGFHYVDTYLLHEDPDFQYSMDTSELSNAHSMGLTLPEYLQYLQGVRDDPYTDAKNMRQWDADMFDLAKTYTDVADGKAPRINPEDQAKQFAIEEDMQRAILSTYAPTGQYVSQDGEIMSLSNEELTEAMQRSD